MSRVDVALAAACGLCLTAAAIAWVSSAPGRHLRNANGLAVPPSIERVDARTLASRVQLVLDANPFRISHKQADVAFARRAQSVNAAPPIRPAFVLKGIVGGPPWRAVIDGIPGALPGTVVSSGNTFDKLVVRSVTRTDVVIQGPDTTWKLSLAKASP
ncbi:MAG TPA: hypothetical protein VKH19_15890 [Gemmatimonadaceae bacterium]|nr:hypothetical protein [Gemmatimonadaceae bacterium]